MYSFYLIAQYEAKLGDVFILNLPRTRIRIVIVAVLTVMAFVLLRRTCGKTHGPMHYSVTLAQCGLYGTFLLSLFAQLGTLDTVQDFDDRIPAR